MYNTIYPSTPLTTCPATLVLASSLFFCSCDDFFFFLFISFAPAILRACVRACTMYGEVHAFVRYSNQINQSALLFFCVTSFFSFSSSFRFCFVFV